MLNPTTSSRPGIYSFLNYRQYLSELANYYLAQGLSFRAIGKKCGFSSPNYLQQILNEKKCLSTKGAEKIAAGLNLNEREKNYFIGLVKLESRNRYLDKSRILKSLREIAITATKRRIKDSSLHSHWLHAVIFSLCDIKNFKLTPANVFDHVGHIASKDDIVNSINFLKAKKWIEPVADQEHIYKQNEIHFVPFDDIRNIDLQRCHLHYLELAKHRINDDVNQREYRGLIQAVPQNKLPQIKQRIRTFFDELRQELDAEAPQADTLVRVQLCMFKLTRMR